jgi:hypothetical protein
MPFPALVPRQTALDRDVWELSVESVADEVAFRHGVIRMSG